MEQHHSVFDFKPLACAIIEKTVDDYRLLQSLGVVNGYRLDLEPLATIEVQRIAWEHSHKSKKPRDTEFTLKKITKAGLDDKISPKTKREAIAIGRQLEREPRAPISIEDAESVVSFLASDQLDSLADYVGINGDAIRYKLGITATV